MKKERYGEKGKQCNKFITDFIYFFIEIPMRKISLKSKTSTRKENHYKSMEGKRNIYL